jgi:hypothetical protein
LNYKITTQGEAEYVRKVIAGKTIQYEQAIQDLERYSGERFLWDAQHMEERA